MGLLNIVIGLILVYLVFAIVVSGVQEWWTQYFGHRGQFLREGLLRLIGDESIFVRVLHHPLIGGLYRDRAARGKPPSYIDPGNFALAFANVILRRANTPVATSSNTNPAPVGGTPDRPLTFQSLRDALVNLLAQRSPVATAVLPIVDRANGDLDAALKGIADWFSGGMDRVSGWYKAYAQKRLFVIGFFVACLANVDTIAIYETLNRSPDLASQLAQAAGDVVQSGQIGGVDLKARKDAAFTPEESQAVLKVVMSTSLPRVPIGYACLNAASTAPITPGDGVAPQSAPETRSTWARCWTEIQDRRKLWLFSDWLLHALGWALTALAGALGAPYWFAALNKVMNIRGSGPKPKQASGAV